MCNPPEVYLEARNTTTGHVFKVTFFENDNRQIDYRPSHGENMESFIRKCTSGTKVHIKHNVHRRIVEFILDSDFYLFVELQDAMYIMDINEFLKHCKANGVGIVFHGSNGHGTIRIKVSNGKLPKALSVRHYKEFLVNDLVDQTVKMRMI